MDPMVLALLLLGCSEASDVHPPALTRIGECLDVVMVVVEVPPTLDACALVEGTRVLHVEQDVCDDGPTCLVIESGEGAMVVRSMGQDGRSEYRFDRCDALSCAEGDPDGS